MLFTGEEREEPKKKSVVKTALLAISVSHKF